jgi:hypothetical protein
VETKGLDCEAGEAACSCTKSIGVRHVGWYVTWYAGMGRERRGYMTTAAAAATRQD